MQGKEPHANSTFMAKAKCGAKCRNGKLCTRPPMAGKKRCRAHGGASLPPGQDHPAYRHGRFSKALPERLRDRFNSFLEDPDLLSARSTAALLATRLSELMEKLDSGENDHLLERIAEAWSAFKDANRRAREAGDDDDARSRAREDAQAATQELDRLISAGGSDVLVWQEIRAVAKEYTGASSVEHKRLVDLNQMLTIEQVMVLSSALLEMNREVISRYAAAHNFDGRRALAEIGNGFALLFNRSPVGAQAPTITDQRDEPADVLNVASAAVSDHPR